MLSHDFAAMYLNHWRPEPVCQIGLHETIATEIATGIRKLIPCYVEGPLSPADGWANVHVDGLNDRSVTITVWADRIIFAIFGGGLRRRKDGDTRLPSCRRVWRSDKLLAEPDCFDWILEKAIFAAVGDEYWSREDRMKYLRFRGRFAPTSMVLGRPYYLDPP